jgi:adenylate kinase
MESRTIFFIGKPGCGKGTQAKLLAAKTDWTILASGAQFRAIAKEDTPVGRKVKEENDIGLLQPHWFAMYLFLKSLFGVKDKDNVIFDGFNRKVMEAQLVLDALHWLGRPFTVLHIAVSDEVVEKRLALRKEIEGRADDNAVDERLKEYHQHTTPAIELFRNAGVLIDINGEQTPEEINAEVNKVLGIQ